MAINFKVRTQAIAYTTGHQDALAEILAKLEEGGEESARQYIADNLRVTR